METAHRYVLEPSEFHPGIKLTSYDRTKGTYFEVYQSSKDKKWHWKLYLASSPQGAAAQSARGYSKRQTAERTILTASKAMREAVQT